MDWLCDNVIGTFPELNQLKAEARPFVSMQGIKVTKAPDLAEIGAK